MTLTDDMALLTAKIYGQLNTSGINPGGRQSVQIVYYTRPTSSPRPSQSNAPLSAADPDETPPIDLVPLALELGEGTRWNKDTGTRDILGDAKLEIARHTADQETEITKALLLGTGLPSTDKAYIKIGSDLYSIPESNIFDEDGLTWHLYLKRVPQ